MIGVINSTGGMSGSVLVRASISSVTQSRHSAIVKKALNKLSNVMGIYRLRL